MYYIAWELHVFHNNNRTKVLSSSADLIKQCHVHIHNIYPYANFDFHCCIL